MSTRASCAIAQNPLLRRIGILVVDIVWEQKLLDALGEKHAADDQTNEDYFTSRVSHSDSVGVITAHSSRGL